MQHNPALDGIRALSVCAVMAFHISRDVLPGGFVGVDVFFVLSGFLITGMLFDEVGKTGTIDLWRFYLRRIMRLWPALLLVLVVFLALAPFLFVDGTSEPNVEVLLSVLYLTDYSKAFWDTPTYLIHTWSLSVEEHFYLVWPIVVLAVARFCPRHALMVFWAAFIAASAWRILDMEIGGDMKATYYRFDTRLSGLILGAAIAVLPWRPGPRSASAIGFVSLAALAWSFATLNRTTEDSLMLPAVLVDLAAAGLVLSVMAPAATLLARLLSWRPVAYVGLISYPLYLWHYLVVRAMRDYDDPWLTAAATVVIGGLLAVLTYELVEKPLRKWRLRVSTRLDHLEGPENIVIAGPQR